MSMGPGLKALFENSDFACLPTALQFYCDKPKVRAGRG